MKKFAFLATMAWRLRKEAKVVWLMLRDSRTPAKAKITAIAAFAYLLSPIDLIPDVLLGVGWIDDAVIVGLLLKWALSMLPPELYEQLRAKVDGRHGSASGKQRTFDADDLNAKKFRF